MRRFELIAPCHFGMESVLKREITDLGYDITDVADGRVTFSVMKKLYAELIFSAHSGENSDQDRKLSRRDI